MHTQFLIVLALVAGALMPLQAGINGQLAAQVSGALNAALISFAVGTLALLIINLCLRDLPSTEALKGLAAWHWLGGLMGAFFIATAALAGPRLGAVIFLALILVGQMSMSLLLDHFGWVGFRHAPITLNKLLGLVLIVAGLIMIFRR